MSLKLNKPELFGTLGPKKVKPTPADHEFQLVDWKIQQLVSKFSGVLSRAEIQVLLELKEAEHLRQGYILPALNLGYLEMTLPDKPSSKLQKYRLTKIGKNLQLHIMS
ncbi:Fic family protein [Paraglaciecola sp. 25GB23A]|uniref:Fic family protein n=1 Tax=Paraglaciecola sp. 25GB23A TaxID=3156068 RepID=UPI0032AEF331